MNIEEIISLYKKGLSIRQIEKIIHKSRHTISKILKENNVRIRNQEITSRKYYCNENYFQKIDNNDKAYWLGFIMADGFIESKRNNGNQKIGICLSKIDKEHLEKFNKCLNSTYQIKDYIGSGYNKTGEFSKVLITSQKMVNDLKQYGIIEQKTKIAKFPLEIPKEYYYDFIRGYLDGDGSIFFTKSTKQWGISFTGTYDMLNNINLIFNKHNKITSSKKDIWEVNYGGNKNVYQLLSKIYENSNIKLERKYQLYLKVKKYIER